MSPDRYYIRNTASISAGEFFWGLGLPVIVDSTILQLFLRSLGASNFIIGMIPVLFNLGIILFSPLSSLFTSHLARKRMAVTVSHIISSLPIFLFGLYLLLFEYTSHTIVIFLISYTAFSLSIGFTGPIWNNFTVRIFSRNRVLQGLSVMLIVQNLSRLAGSIIISRIVSLYSFDSKSSGIIFLFVGIVFFIGALAYLFTRETGPSQNRQRHGIQSLLKSFRHIVGNRDFMLFLISEIGFFAGISVISFYAIYAVEFSDISLAVASGGFMVFYCLGSLVTNIVFGYLKVFSLKGKYLTARILTLMGILFLVFFNRHTSLFLLSCFLFGMGNTIRALTYSLTIKVVSQIEDPSDYYAAAPVLTLPFSVILPLLVGKYLDITVSLGAMSYKLFFLVMGVLVALSIIPLIKAEFGK